MKESDIKIQLLSLYEEISREFNVPQGILIRDYQRHIHTIHLVHNYVPYTHKKILDVAAGWAIPSRVLLQEGYEVHITDSYVVGGEHVCGFNKNIFPFTRIDDLEKEKLPFSENTFDAILWLGTIEHLQNSPKRVLEWMHRILKKNGFLIIDTPNILELRRRIMFLFGESFMPQIKFIFDAKRHVDHHFEYTKSDLEYATKKSGFKIVYSNIVDTISAITIDKKTRHKDRKEGESELRQMTQFKIGFDITNVYSYIKIPYSILVKLVPSFRDTLFIVGEKT